MNYDTFKTIVWPSLSKLLYNRGICSCSLYPVRTTPNTYLIGITKLSDNFQIDGPSGTYGDLRQSYDLVKLREIFRKLDKRIQEVMKEALESFDIPYIVHNDDDRILSLSSYIIDLTKLN